MHNINDIISGIEDAYTFLHTTIYLDKYVHENMSIPKIEAITDPIILKSDKGKEYLLNNDHIIRGLGLSYNMNLSLLGDIAIIFSSRAIFSYIYEGLVCDNDSFKKFSESFLGTQYESFEIIIRALRNIFSHNISRQYSNIDNNLADMLNHLKNNKKPFSYSLKHNLSPQKEGDKYQKINISIDFSKIKVGDSLWKLFRSNDLLILIDLCHKICTEYRLKNPN